MSLKYCIGFKPNLILVNEQLHGVDGFGYFVSCIAPSGRISEEFFSRICKTRLGFINLRHLWRQRDTYLSI